MRGKRRKNVPLRLAGMLCILNMLWCCVPLVDQEPFSWSLAANEFTGTLTDNTYHRHHLAPPQLPPRTITTAARPVFWPTFELLYGSCELEGRRLLEDHALLVDVPGMLSPHRTSRSPLPKMIRRLPAGSGGLSKWRFVTSGPS